MVRFMHKCLLCYDHIHKNSKISPIRIILQHNLTFPLFHYQTAHSLYWEQVENTTHDQVLNIVLHVHLTCNI